MVQQVHSEQNRSEEQECYVQSAAHSCSYAKFKTEKNHNSFFGSISGNVPRKMEHTRQGDCKADIHLIGLGLGRAEST